MKVSKPKRILSTILSILMVVSLLPMQSLISASAASDLSVTIDTDEYVTLKDSDGDNYYEIATANELYAFAAIVNVNENANINAKLTADITVNEGKMSDSTTDARAWTPIASSIPYYNGNFDGNGKTISGLYINDSGLYYAGLFGEIASGGTIRNLTIKDSYFNGSNYVGGIVGYSDGIIENCHNISSTVKGYSAGGIAGFINNTITDCSNSGEISSSYAAGGIAGKLYDTPFTNHDVLIQMCNNSGKISSPSHAGGIVGENTSGDIANCYNTGLVCDAEYSGGIIGISAVYGDNATINNCYNQGKMDGTYKVGGIAGSGYKLKVTNCYSTAEFVDCDAFFQTGILGYRDGTEIINCYFLDSVCEYGIGKAYTYSDRSYYCNEVGSAEPKSAEQFANGEVAYLLQSDQAEGTWGQKIGTDSLPVLGGDKVFAGYDNRCDTLKRIYSNTQLSNTDKVKHTLESDELVCQVCGKYDEAIDSDKDGYYEIDSLSKLYWFANQVNGGQTSMNAKLTADITVNPYTVNASSTNAIKWTPIGNDNNIYAGIFDGDNKTISGLYFNDSEANQVGLFGKITKNAEIKNVTVAKSYIKGKQYVAGVVGYNDQGKVTNCTNTSVIEGNSYIAGVLGYNFEGTIKDCKNSGTIKGTSYISGVVGKNDSGNVQNCSNSGQITGERFIGGVIGYNYHHVSNEIVDNCFNTGYVNGIEFIGGVIGYNEDQGNDSRVTNCYNTGTIKGTNSVGGVVGHVNYGGFKNCYNKGTVSGNNKIGGIAGYLNDGKASFYAVHAEISNCYNEGNISGKNNVGGVAGLSDPGCNFKSCNVPINIRDCYNTGKITGTESNTGGLLGGCICAGVYNSYNNGEVIGKENVGGVVGKNSESRGKIENCSNNGTVTGDSNVGGVAGQNYNASTITSSFNTGVISSKTHIGGIAGLNSFNCIISKCYNAGKVNGTDYASGIVGQNYGEITDSYNTAKVSGTNYVGGVVGDNSTGSDKGSVTNCYNIGSISGTSYVGGVAGNDYNGKVKNCYYLNTTYNGGINGSDRHGYAVSKNSNQFASGEVCCLLGTSFGQKLGTDNYPVIDGAKVNHGYLNCLSTSKIYSNDSIYETIPTHTYVNGICSICDSYESAIDSDDDGYYEIDNAGKLYWFSAQVNSGNTSMNVKLTEDITVNNGTMTAESTNARVWTPIANLSYKYNGIFDGNNKTISGLYLNDSSLTHVGLFNVINTNGQVKNVTIKNSYFNGYSSVAGIVGNNKGTITGCYNMSTINATDIYSGGIVGNNEGTIKNCHNSGKITSTENYCGGISGRNLGTVKNCSNEGLINGTTDVGGIVGYNNGTIELSFNTASIKGTSSVGGICGWNLLTTTNCYNTGSVTGSDMVAGIAGVCTGESLTNCFSTGKITADKNPGGIVAYDYGTNISNCYFLNTSCSGSYYCVSITGLFETKTIEQFNSGEVAYLLQKNQTEQIWGQKIGTDLHPVYGGEKVYCGYMNCLATSVSYANNKLYNKIPTHNYDITGFCTICNNMTSAKDSNGDGYYEISTAGELYWFAGLVNGTIPGLMQNKSANAILTADINLANSDWRTIAETGLYYNAYGTDLGYSGTFDGKGHVIKNLKITSSSTRDASCGLFGTVSGTVKNLGVEGVTFVDGGKDIRAGAIVGQLITSSGMISNCYVNNAIITPGEHVTGGIAGCVYDGTIKNCYVVNSDINGSLDRFGYIVGDSRADRNSSDRPGTVENCYADKTPLCSGREGYTSCEEKTTEQFASGEVAYLLNGSANGGSNWYQNLTNGKNVDSYPVLSKSHGTIYYGYKNCEATEETYINHKPLASQGHKYSTATCKAASVCSNCGNIGAPIDPDNHTSYNTYFVCVDNNTHKEYHQCCDAFIAEEEHNIRESGCTNSFYCYDCKNTHTESEIIHLDGCTPVWVHDSITHTKKYSKCGNTVEESAPHELIYTVDEETDTISAHCEICGAEGSVTMNIDSCEYNGYNHTATATKTGIFDGWRTVATPVLSYSDENGCKNVGDYTATMTLGDYIVTKEFTISPRELSIYAVYANYKSYDTTNYIYYSKIGVGGIVTYDTGEYDGEWDDIRDSVSLVTDNISVTVNDSVPGDYSVVKITGLAINGEDSYNYTIPETLENVPLKTTYGSSSGIINKSVWIYLEHQYITAGQELDQTAYTVEGLDETFELSNVTLYKDDYGYINVDTESIVVTHNGEDVSDYFDFYSYSANLTEVCEGHTFNENGLCSTGSCNVYEPAVETYNEYDEVVYEIYNAGQLYWFGEQVNEYYNNFISCTLMNDINVNPGYTFNSDGTYTGGDNPRVWIPIGKDYPPYTGNFNGNGYTISGLYFNDPEANFVGLFGYTGYAYPISDVHVSNSYFCGNEYVGGLIGCAESVINKCSVDNTVTVKGNSYIVGGFAGYASGGEINNSYSLANIQAELAGGIVGENCAYLNNCYTTYENVVVYNNSYYGGYLENCYNLEKPDEYDGTTAISIEAITSGELAYILQSNIAPEQIYDEETDEYIEGETPHIWGQNIGTELFPAINGEKVYYGYENCADNAVKKYTNLSTVTKEKPEHKWEDNICNGCDTICEHNYDENYVCDICGYEKHYKVTFVGEGIEFSDTELKAYHGKDYVVTLTPPQKTTISTVTCLADGKNEIEITFENNVLTIPADKINSNITIYAELTASVTVFSNGATLKDDADLNLIVAPNAINAEHIKLWYDYNSQIPCLKLAELIESYYEKTNYELVGFNTKADGTGTAYETYDEITINEDTNLYAVYELKTYLVSLTETNSINGFTNDNYEEVTHGKDAIIRLPIAYDASTIGLNSIKIDSVELEKPSEYLNSDDNGYFVNIPADMVTGIIDINFTVYSNVSIILNGAEPTEEMKTILDNLGESTSDDVVDIPMAYGRLSAYGDFSDSFAKDGCNKYVGAKLENGEAFDLNIPITNCTIELQWEVEHKFNNSHYCTECGEIREGETTGVAGYTVTLEDKIAVNFHMALSDEVIADENARVLFTYVDSGETFTNEIPLSEVTVSGRYYVFTCNVAAKEMTSAINVQVISDYGNSDIFEYTVQEYCEYILANPEQYADAIPLIKAMLNYGAYAQTYFGYNTDSLANSNLDEADKVLADELDLSEFAGTTSGEQEGVSFYGCALSLKSETAIKLYFEFENEKYVNTLPITVNGEATTATKNGKYYEIKISDIPAHKLADMFEVKVGNLTLNYGAFSYGNIAMSTNKETLKNTIKAMYNYNQEALAYIK